MRLVIECVLYNSLFTLLVKLAVGNNPVNGLYFYPKEYQKTAYQRHIADRNSVEEKRMSFMPGFIFVMAAALIIAVHWNKPGSFASAYLQSLVILEVNNWYDGIVIDKLWVGHSRFWQIKGMEDIPYIQSYRQMLRKRIILSGIWVIGAAVAALIVTLTGGIG